MTAIVIGADSIVNVVPQKFSVSHCDFVGKAVNIRAVSLSAIAIDVGEVFCLFESQDCLRKWGVPYVVILAMVTA